MLLAHVGHVFKGRDEFLSEGLVMRFDSKWIFQRVAGEVGLFQHPGKQSP